MLELDFEFNILEKLYNASSHTLKRVDLANSFGPDAVTANTLITSLIGKGLIVQRVGSELISLKKPEGIEQYLLEKQRRDNNAKQAAAKDAEQRAQAIQIEKNKKQQFRHDFIVGIVSSLVSAALTLFIEHFQEIVNATTTFLASLFT